ncbi:unnamed protein product [Mytilus coruscus]|uniref:COL6A n=1 Tax=Mytilus coruscus TaxID=42192 RepID=A0A6J8BJB0_MYTCO|nr:unnamed protein product [Mytilus coruscus]
MSLIPVWLATLFVACSGTIIQTKVDDQCDCKKIPGLKDEVTRLTAAITLAERTCKTKAVDCGWSDYGPWTDCTKTCSGGTRTRNRTCTNPSPSNGGAACSGSAVQIEACNTDPCPVCSAKADVVFLLDSSGSVTATNFKKILEFIKGVVSKFSVGPNDIQVGVDTFQDTVKSEFKLNQYHDKNNLITAIGNIVYQTGGTKTGPAIKFMTTNSFSTAAGHRTGVPKICIVITDGKSNNKANTLAESEKARASGIQLIAIGVGNGVNQIELEGIANKPKADYVYHVKNFDVLNTLQASLSSKTCEACTKTCGHGTRTRTRTCTKPSPAKGGAPCNGSAVQSEACNINPCPVDGGWSTNDPWSVCTKTCGGGIKTKTRTCTNPSPSNGGTPCNGKAVQSQACNINPCAPCPLGWAMYGNSCYFFSDTSAKWTDALRICQTKKSMLAEIGSSGENGFLKRTASGYGGIFWLGGTDSGSEGNWYWRTSGTRFSVTDWNSSTENRGGWWSSKKVTIQEPNNLDGKEHCLEFADHNGYKWNDNGCWKSFKYICEKGVQPLLIIYQNEAQRKRMMKLAENVVLLDATYKESGVSGPMHAQTRKKVIDYIRTMKICTKKEDFSQKVQMLQEKMPSKQITDYLLDNWCTDKWGCQWANYGRHLFYEDQDTNNLVERFFLGMKYHFLGGYANSRVEDLLILLHGNVTMFYDYLDETLKNMGGQREDKSKLTAENMLKAGLDQTVQWTSSTECTVPLQTAFGTIHNVDIVNVVCNCPAATTRGMCKHVHLAELIASKRNIDLTVERRSEAMDVFNAEQYFYDRDNNQVEVLSRLGNVSVVNLTSFKCTCFANSHGIHCVCVMVAKMVVPSPYIQSTSIDETRQQLKEDKETTDQAIKRKIEEINIYVNNKNFQTIDVKKKENYFTSTHNGITYL